MTNEKRNVYVTANRKSYSKSKSVLALVAAFCVLGTTSAYAEIMTAASGDAWTSAAEPCIRRDWGRVTNQGPTGSTCNGALYSIGVRAITGSRSFKVTGCSAGHVSCAAIVTDRSGANIWWTGQTQLTTACGAGVPTATPLGTRSVAATEGVVFECVIDPDGIALGADWIGTVEY
jgi:hypothetical protein